jgi:spore coat protein U-like protein
MACAIAWVLVLAPQASAQFRTPREAASPRAQTGCKLKVRPFDFGPFVDGSASSITTSAIFELKCSNIGTAAPVVSAGPSATTGDYQNRRMNGPGGSQLRYQVFTNPSRTIVWGDGTRDTQAIVASTPGDNKTFTVYGELFGNQYGEVGRYGDAIVVTVFP